MATNTIVSSIVTPFDMPELFEIILCNFLPDDLARCRDVCASWGSTILNAGPGLRKALFRDPADVDTIIVQEQREDGSDKPSDPSWAPRKVTLSSDALLVGSPGTMVVTTLHPLLLHGPTDYYNAHYQAFFEVPPKLLTTKLPNCLRSALATQPKCTRVKMIIEVNDDYQYELVIVNTDGVRLGDILDTILDEMQYHDECRDIDPGTINFIGSWVVGFIADCSPWVKGARGQVGGIVYTKRGILHKVSEYQWERIYRVEDVPTRP